MVLVTTFSLAAVLSSGFEPGRDLKVLKRFLLIGVLNDVVVVGGVAVSVDRRQGGAIDGC